MPVYEYDCLACGQKFSLLIGMVSKPDEEVCPTCGSLEINRRVSRFRRMRSEDDRFAEISDRLERGEPETSAEMRSLVKEMGRAGDEEASDELEEMLEMDLEGKGEPD